MSVNEVATELNILDEIAFHQLFEIQDEEQQYWRNIYQRLQVLIVSAHSLPFHVKVADYEGEILAITQTDYASLKRLPEFTCEEIPTLPRLVHQCTSKAVYEELNLEAAEETRLIVPAMKTAAITIIQAGYRPNGNIWSGIDLTDLTPGITAPAVHVAYYISCLVYLCNLEPQKVFKNMECFSGVGSWTGIFRSIDNRTVVDAAHREFLNIAVVCTHAVLGALAMCKDITSKANFQEWVKERHNIIAALLYQKTSEGVRVADKESLNAVYKFCANQPNVRKFVYEVTQCTADDNNIAASVIKSQVAMLTAYTGMTPYILIKRLIATGGPLLVVDPIPKQLLRFLTEQETVVNKLVADSYTKDDLAYIHLLYPNYHCFKAYIDYPDLLHAAIEKLKIDQASSETQTIKSYKAETTSANLFDTRCDSISLLEEINCDDLMSKIPETTIPELMKALVTSEKSKNQEIIKATVLDIIEKITGSPLRVLSGLGSSRSEGNNPYTTQVEHGVSNGSDYIEQPNKVYAGKGYYPHLPKVECPRLYFISTLKSEFLNSLYETNKSLFPANWESLKINDPFGAWKSLNQKVFPYLNYKYGLGFNIPCSV